MDVAEFDLDRYLRASSKVDLSRVPWDRVRELAPLAAFRASDTPPVSAPPG
jgi:hypothetical protein